MSKKAKILFLIAGLLIIGLVCAFCIEYFVLQMPLFDRGGWHTAENGAVQYLDYYARPMTGWQTIDAQRYYFDADGTMHTGWLSDGSRNYYFDTDGTMHTGWLQDGDKRYYMTDRGTPHVGWLEEAGKRFYFRAPGGTMVADEWLTLSEGTYYLDSAGQPQTGWVEHEGLRYYFGEDGRKNNDWQDTAQGLTYLENGEKYTGWLNAPQGKFYFNQDGYAQTGWITDETGRFYLYGDGTYAQGFVEINGITRYFMPTGEYIILCNRWNPIPDDYAMNLVDIGKFKMDATCSKAMEEMMQAAAADGVTLKINNSYRSKKTQQSMWDTRVIKYMGQGMSRAEADAHIGRSVAIPGTSEHQTGLAVDIKGSQKVYDWLAENSWKYGFILRYPDDKIEITGIIFEPWHFRYVGQTLAKDIYDSGLCMEEYFEMLKKQ